MLGAAMGLLDAKAFDHLAGRVVFFAVPAEEYGDIEWRVAQARAGRLEFLGGKPELLRLGHFDDVDLAMMIHMTSRTEDGKTGVPVSNNGCIVKTVRYLGRASHAGGAPHQGINALYAAHIGLTADQRHPRDLPRRGHDPRASDHHARRLAGERDPGRGAAGDVRARPHAWRRSSTPTRRSTARSGPARWRSAPRSRSRRCPATCR